MNSRSICRLVTRRCLTNRPRVFAPPKPSVSQCFHQARHISSRGERERLLGRDSTVDAETAIRNPLDRIANRRRIRASMADDWRRFKLLAGGVVVCMALSLGVMYLAELPDPYGDNDDSRSSSSSSSSKKDKSKSKNKNKNNSELSASPSSLFSLLSRGSRADSGRPSDEDFQGKKVLVVAGGAKIVAHDDKSGEDLELVPTGTSSVPHFPKTIRLPNPSVDGGAMAGVVDDLGALVEQDAEYTLIGLGIRTVSFLGIQVYVLGLYVQTSSLAALQSRLVKRVNPLATALIPGEKEELRQSLLDGQASQVLWEMILKDPKAEINSAFRIVPTRNTDFQHLRDGWVRGITSRTQVASQQGDGEFQDESFGLAMKEFNTLFAGKGKAPKGTVILLTRDGKGKLEVLFQDKDGQLLNLGRLDDERVSRLIWLGYLGGKNVSSENARKGIADGIIELVERPVGTAALKVS